MHMRGFSESQKSIDFNSPPPERPDAEKGQTERQPEAKREPPTLEEQKKLALDFIKQRPEYRNVNLERLYPLEPTPDPDGKVEAIVFVLPGETFTPDFLLRVEFDENGLPADVKKMRQEASFDHILQKRKKAV